MPQYLVFYLCVSMYLGVGIIYVIWRLSDKTRYDKIIDEAYKVRPSVYLIVIAVPIVFVLFVITWPVHFLQFVKRKLTK